MKINYKYKKSLQQYNKYVFKINKSISSQYIYRNNQNIFNLLPNPLIIFKNKIAYNKTFNQTFTFKGSKINSDDNSQKIYLDINLLIYFENNLIKYNCDKTKTFPGKEYKK